MQGSDTGRHEYRMKGWLRGFYLLLGVLMCGMGIFFAWMPSQQTGQGAVAMIGIFPAAIGIYLLAMVLRSRLTIEGTRIEVRGTFREKQAEMGEVEGFRTINTRNGSFWRLQLKQGRGSITIQKWFDCGELRWWFQQLTDLDEQDRRKLLGEIEQNQGLGATPEDRLAALKRARQRNIGLFAIAVIAAVGLFAGATQWQLPAAMVLALVPVVALYLLNAEPLLYGVGTPRRDPRADLSIALFASALGLISNCFHLHFVSLMPLLPAMAVVALAFIAGFYMLGGKGPRTPRFHAMVLMCGAFYSFGLMAACDTLLDHAKPAPYSAQVVGKHESSGRSTTYYLDFNAWGPFTGANSVSVPESVFNADEAGVTVCFDVYPGALHAGWFSLVPCGGPQEIQTTP